MSSGIDPSATMRVALEKGKEKACTVCLTASVDGS